MYKFKKKHHSFWSPRYYHNFFKQTKYNCSENFKDWFLIINHNFLKKNQKVSRSIILFSIIATLSYSFTKLLFLHQRCNTFLSRSYHSVLWSLTFCCDKEKKNGQTYQIGFVRGNVLHNFNHKKGFLTIPSFYTSG